jgi:predicted homoserine dehydrogenase-like protein
MYLETLHRAAQDRTVRVLLMGAGEYGVSFLAWATTAANPIPFHST